MNTSSAHIHKPLAIDNTPHPRDRRETLATMARSTSGYLTRYLAGFSDRNRATQSMDVPNHAIWILGHCAMTMHRLAERMDGRSLPESDFVKGDGKQGNAERFDTESVSFGSTPVDNPAFYPTLERGLEIYENACERFATAIVNTPDAKLDEPQDWHGGPVPLYMLIMRVCFHNGTHAGQLTDLRRALHLPHVIVPQKS